MAGFYSAVDTVATVMVPVSSMQGLLTQLTDTMKQIQAQAKQPGGAALP